LEGRAIQDVLISPPRRERESGELVHEYGTTVRLYDPKIDAWHVTWNPPVYGGNVSLVARAEGDDIVLEGTGPEGDLYRWLFTDITDDRFVWRGYISDDDGASWYLDEEMTARRRDQSL
jgi:hypothetical protein